MSKPKSLRQLIPDAASVEAMHPSELGGHILDVLRNLETSDAGQRHRGNFCGAAGDAYSANIRQFGAHQGVRRACAGAWLWLETNHLVCPEPGNDGWYFITRKGEAARDANGIRILVDGEQLPESFLHPSFIRDVRAHFLQGRYDTAVLVAFHLLEIAIRNRAGLGHEHFGIKLVQRAFHPDTGELNDLAAEAGERVALMNLMAGALGSYKNPQSHRHVGVDAAEAREMIIIASHLLNIVESRPQLT